MRARGSPRANTTLGPAACAPPLARGGCVVLIHLHKSAGTSLLRPLGVHGSALECSGGLYHCDAYLYTQTRCLMAVEKRPSLGGSGSWAATHPRLDYDNAYLYFGGYVQAMATATSRAQQRGCLRVAVLREPVARLVSAMLYCARARPKVAYRAEDGGDVLCGNRSSGSPEEWAAHWGSYLWRQLALEPALFAALATCPRSGGRRAGDAPCSLADTRGELAGWRAAGGRAAGWRAAGWRGRTRLHGWRSVPLRRQRRRREHGAAVGARATVDRMRSGALFDVVGIVEEWDGTMALFDALLLASGGRRWASAATAVTHGPGRWAAGSARRSQPRESARRWRSGSAPIRSSTRRRARFGVLVRRHVPAIRKINVTNLQSAVSAVSSSVLYVTRACTNCRLPCCA